MGALAAFAPWTPEDDLLLKNAVEAGASLESLAKGAVQFSRRFTVREIQDRWYSLLYDPIISVEASAYMSNFELSASLLPSKFSKFGPSKESKFSSVKRKADNVHNSYYAMHKRICNATLTSVDLSFLVGPENSYYVESGSGALPENCMPEGAASNNFVFHESNFDSMHCDFPENVMDGSVTTNGKTAHSFYTGANNPCEENFCIDQQSMLNKEPQILGDDVSLDGGVEEVGDPKELSVDSLIGDSSLGTMALSAFDQINSDHGNLCSEFDGNHVFNSPDLECGTSFNTFQLSPLPEMPIWRTDEGVHGADLSCHDFKDSIARGETYLSELSNSLLNFTNDEELYLMDVDGKDRFDKSYYDGLSSLILNSPNDVSTDQIPEITEAETLVASHAQVTNPSILCHVQVDDNMGLCSSVGQAQKTELQMTSHTTIKDCRYHGLIYGVISCTLNTEAPEIPSNDNVFLPFDVPPSTVPSLPKWTFQEVRKPMSSSFDDFGHGHRAGERGKILMPAEQKNPGEPHSSSCMMGSPPLLGPVVGSQVKTEFPNSHASHMACGSAILVSGGAGGIVDAENTCTDAHAHLNPKEESTNHALAKNLDNNLTNSFTEKPAHGSKSLRNYSQPNTSGMRQEQDIAMPIQDHQLLHAEVGSAEVVGSELVANQPTSDQEEQYIESDDDVPYYSDIEAMILDMDLDSDDQDLYHSEEVSRYQQRDAKRAIIRLEQGVHSYMQRAIASHGAFAILYGRHSKHHIKEPEIFERITIPFP